MLLKTCNNSYTAPYVLNELFGAVQQYVFAADEAAHLVVVSWSNDNKTLSIIQ